MRSFARHVEEIPKVTLNTSKTGFISAWDELKMHTMMGWSYLKILYGFGPIEELEYFEATAGQFVEYDDEGEYIHLLHMNIRLI